MFSNLAGVHQSFYLLKPAELEDLHEIIVDTVYMEEPCPQCGLERVFHHPHIKGILLEHGKGEDLPCGV
jgi:hypothetical protein